MKLSKLYLVLATVISLSMFFIPIKTLFAAVPVQIRINVGSVTDNQVANQLQILKELHSLFKNNRVHAGFWFNGAAYQQIKNHDPNFLRQLFEDRFVIAHHGANSGRKGSRLIDTVSKIDWDTAVDWAVNYEKRENGGGLSQLQKDFDDRIQVTGRFFLAPILQATKQLGCEAMIGLKDQLNAPTNAAWYMGMFNLPDRITIMPDMIRKSTSNPGMLYKQIDQFASQWPDHSIETISILVHDKDFFRGLSPEQHDFFSTYKNLVLWISRNPNLETVTYYDLIKRVIDDRRPLIESSIIFKAAQQLLLLDKLPEFISVDDVPFSLTDLFYAFSSSLSNQYNLGKLPEQVQVEGLLGPVAADQGDLPSHITSKELVSSISSWFQLKKEYVPTLLQVNGKHINSAEILFAMAELFSNLYQEKNLPNQIILKQVSLFPAQSENCPDLLSRLQFWTYKPQRPVIRVEKADPPESSQTANTPIYVTVYSHNEGNFPWVSLVNDPELYRSYRSNLIRKVKLIRKHNAALSWQSDFAVLQAMHKHETGSLLNETNGKNILQWMVEDMGVEIAPHGHLTKYNYADIAYLIKQMGVTPAAVIGGFALYSCNPDKPGIAEHNWMKNLEISPGGTIAGRNYPDFIWKPKILVQPAMIGHVFDEFSSGVWKPGRKGHFIEHDTTGHLIVIGQGYPHYVENIGHQMTGGAMVRSSSLGYIKELAETIQKTPEMQNRIYTASIHTRDYLTVADINTYDALEKTLEDIAPLIRSKRVVFMNYEGIATIWEKQYKGTPNRYSIEKTSLSHILQQDLLKYCQNTPTDQPDKMHLNKCGDNVCDAHEKRTGFCKSDCPELNGSEKDIQHNFKNLHLCGDGVCDAHEQESGMCKRDCK